MTPKKAWETLFLKRLAETGNIAESCKKAKISRTAAYERRNADSDFAAQWGEALEMATEALEYEARRRAEKGTLEPIYYKGKRAGTVRKYSDTLLIFLLKAHKPEKYRETVRNEHSGPGGSNIVIKVVYGDDRVDGQAAQTA